MKIITCSWCTARLWTPSRRRSSPTRAGCWWRAGKTLRIYELGKRKLLRKCEYRNIPEGIMWMHVKGDKIYAADLRESSHIFKYRRSDNQLFVLADDAAPRWMTSASVRDGLTMAGADKFD